MVRKLRATLGVAAVTKMQSIPLDLKDPDGVNRIIIRIPKGAFFHWPTSLPIGCAINVTEIQLGMDGEEILLAMVGTYIDPQKKVDA